MVTFIYAAEVGLFMVSFGFWCKSMLSMRREFILSVGNHCFMV